MKVLKVIVDEMPKDCEQCYYLMIGGFCSAFMNWREFKRTDETTTRPSWCPLEVETDEPKEVKGE